MDAIWRIEMLGDLRPVRYDRVVSRFQTQKAGALLAYLAYYRHRSHPREMLVELLWPGSDPKAGRVRLRGALSSLRRQLEPPGVVPRSILLADSASVRLNPTACRTDVEAFEKALQVAARDVGHSAKIQALTDAIDLYRGELLPAYTEEWVLLERQRLSEELSQALEQLIALSVEAGDLPGALQWARRAVAADPFREEAHGELMRLLLAANRPEAALRHYRELEQILAQELGTVPAREIRDLARKIEQVRSEGAGRERRATFHPGPAAQPSVVSSSTLLPTGTVTFLLAGMEEEAREPCRDLLLAIWRGCGGQEVRTAGDMLQAVFRQASQALAAAVAGQRALAARRRPEGAEMVRAQMALHTGEVELREGRYHGSALSRVTRLLLVAHPGQILLTEESAVLVRQNLEVELRLTDLGLFRLHDAGPAERLFQVEYPELGERRLPLPRAPRAHLEPLPRPLTRCLGREVEIAALCEMLTTLHLVTLTGPGGSGKTRLALEVAARVREAFEGAVWFVSLVDITDPDRIADKIVDVLGLHRSLTLTPSEQVVIALSRRPSLLVIDNFEHLALEGARLLRTLMDRVEPLTLLVTSRQRLNLDGEREFPVMPLPVPVPGDREPGSEPGDLEALLQNPSVQLFVDRAQAARPDFQLTESNACAVAALCQQLEGLPLAIELAAARIGVLTPAQLLSRLSRRFDLLVSRKPDAVGRHRSLRAALDWSYQLLTPELQRLFARLSVFRGGWTLHAAEVVCGECEVRSSKCEVEAEWRSALDALEQLRECSLIVTEEASAPPDFALRTSNFALCEMRYRLLETLREYGSEQLTSPERAELSRRHAAYYLALAEEAEGKLQSAARREWQVRVEREHDNLRAALAWSRSEAGDKETEQRLAAALHWFWDLSGRLNEGRSWLEGALARSGGYPRSGSTERTRERARTLYGAGGIAYLQGDQESARSRTEESRSISEALGDRHGEARALCLLGLMVPDGSDAATARLLFETSVRLFREVGDRWGLAQALRYLGLVESGTGNPSRGRALIEESLAIAREVGDPWPIGWALQNLAWVTRSQGDEEAAHRLLEESLAFHREAGHGLSIAVALSRLANLTRDRGDFAAARALYEESLAMQREQGARGFIALSLENLGLAARLQGDLPAARSCYEESLAIQRERGDRHAVAHVLRGLAAVDREEKDYARARSRLEEGLALVQELEDKSSLLACLEGLAAVAGAGGQSERAVRLFAATEAARRTLVVPLPPSDRKEQENHLAALRRSLGEAAFAAAWTVGQSLTIGQACAAAIGAIERAGQSGGRKRVRRMVGSRSEGSFSAVRGDLTQREWERIAPLLPASTGQRGRSYQDHRRVISGILWKLRTGGPWRDLPERYGSWHTCHDRYSRWRREGLWDRILQTLRDLNQATDL